MLTYAAPGRAATEIAEASLQSEVGPNSTVRIENRPEFGGLVLVIYPHKLTWDESRGYGNFLGYPVIYDYGTQVNTGQSSYSWYYWAVYTRVWPYGEWYRSGTRGPELMTQYEAYQQSEKMALTANPIVPVSGGAEIITGRSRYDANTSSWVFEGWR